MSLKIGDEILDGKYRIEKALGEGVFGKVFLAQDQYLSRQVAIKELRREDWIEEQYIEFRRRFQREAQIGASLKHQNVVDVYTLERSGEDFYLVMEYVDGPSLAQRLEHDGPLPVQKAIEIAIQLCDGLAAVHDHPLGIVHRDVKPSNILLTSQGQPKITDFGLAQLAAESGRSLGKGERHPGTPLYISPEQETTAGYLRPASDEYSLGCVLFEMLTGKTYKTVEATKAGTWRPEVPEWLDEILSKVLAHDWQSRYGNAAHLRRDLEQGLTGELVRKRKLDSFLKQAHGALAAKKWSEVIRICEEGLRLEAGHAEFESLLAKAEGEEERERREHWRRLPMILAGAGGGLVCLVVVLSMSCPWCSWCPWCPNPTPSASAVAFLDASPTATPAYTPAASPTSTSTLTATPTSTATSVATPASTSTRVAPPTPSPINSPSPSASAASPRTPSPSAERVAFVSERDGNPEIYIMNMDGSGARRLTNNPATDNYPSLSPNGSAVGFIRDNQIYVISPDGSSERNLTPYPAAHSAPFWSPDGERIAFKSDRDDPERGVRRSSERSWEIYVMNADGSGITRLTDNQGRDSYCAWSPDGERIVFYADRDGNWAVYSMNPDGSDVTLAPDIPLFACTHVRSPDGTRTVFVTNDRPDQGSCYPGCNCEILVANADGSGQIKLTNNPGVDYQPQWSLDGKHILFVSDRDGNPEIYMMNADGSQQTNLTRNPAPDYFHHW